MWQPGRDGLETYLLKTETLTNMTRDETETETLGTRDETLVEVENLSRPRHLMLNYNRSLVVYHLL